QSPSFRRSPYTGRRTLQSVRPRSSPSASLVLPENAANDICMSRSVLAWRRSASVDGQSRNTDAANQARTRRGSRIKPIRRNHSLIRRRLMRTSARRRQIDGDAEMRIPLAVAVGTIGSE
ncbi:hypothetical protein LSAT2_028182, partial [Lamellibrachia satsuma]